MFGQDALQEGLVPAVRVVAFVLGQAKGPLAYKGAEKEVDASSLSQGEEHFPSHGEDCACPSGGFGVSLADRKLNEQREDDDLEQVVQHHHVAEQVAQSAFDVELVHQDKRHGRRGGDSDGADQEGFKQRFSGDEVEGKRDGGPGQQPLDQADDKGRLPDFFHPRDVQLFADAEGD